MNKNAVISADNPLDACVKVAERYNICSVGLHWKVSEKGFGGHPDDDIIDDHEIIKEINKRKKKN
jgi:hypothetical protein